VYGPLLAPPREESNMSNTHRDLSQETLAGEAREMHEWLDDRCVPARIYDEERGKLQDEKGSHYYLIPLGDRMRIYINGLLGRVSSRLDDVQETIERGMEVWHDA
jgi:hypothetical protein